MVRRRRPADGRAGHRVARDHHLVRTIHRVEGDVEDGHVHRHADEHDIRPLRATLDAARAVDQQLRDDYGPPGAYDPRQFGGSNIYYTPALMWNELRVELGDDEFYRVARSWLAAHDNTSVSREQAYDHWESETGLELSEFFDAWIVGRTTPGPGVPAG